MRNSFTYKGLQFLLYACFLSLSTMYIAVAQKVLVVSDEKGEYPISTELFYLEDSLKTLSIYEIASGKYDHLFKQLENTNTNLGFSNSAFWVKLEIDNQTTRQENFFLEINYPMLDSIEIYYDELDKWLVKKSGDYFPFSTREVKNRNFVFPITISTWDSKVFYLRISSDGNSVRLPMTLWTPIAFSEYNHNIQFFFGIIYGIILLIILENIYIFFSIRDTSYLYYVFAMLSSFFLITILNGHAFEYLWPENVWMQNHILPVITLSLGFWTAVFCRDFLEMKEYSPVLDKILMSFALVTVGLMIPSIILPSFIMSVVTSLIGLLEGVTLFIASLLAVYRGSHPARYFLLGFSCYGLGLLVYSVKHLGLIPLNLWTDNSIQIGAAAQVILLSFALGSKLKEFKRRNAKVKEEALQLQKQINEQLEEKVAERTQEIQEKAHELEAAYRNMALLSQIGQEITSTLSIEDIFSKLYRYVNDMMDASVFGVDIYNSEKQVIEYKLNIERNQRLPSEVIPMTDTTNLSVWVVKNRKEVFMNDFAKEYINYIPDYQPPPVADVEPASVIYIPLVVGDKVLGVTTVQSFEKNAYTHQHLEIMRTLASYTSIALDNASAYHEIENSNIKITQSIRYAKRIQDAILPDTELIKKNFEEYFIIYHPKDIVSGDFYWFAELPSANGSSQTAGVILAVVDCTGHGVPGAFMTMMGNDLLNQIVIENEITSPDYIIAELDKKVTKNLDSSLEKRNDGMDVAVAVIEREKQLIHFAGAKLPLYRVRNGVLDQIKGNIFPVGSKQYKNDKVFDKHSISYQKGDTIYLFSDGFQDQFGGDKKSKYTTKRFRHFLTEMYGMSMEEQKEMLEKELIYWKNGGRQTDDILVMGFKL
ncbi:7TM diverse intracellular signaling domain-containing protein [Thermoflexibacter ruber]|uniref:Serine phosphatase RsbU, regulator of sigma subunit n=1 Tax=Thermoflexibacter ruber TaxID=1003 RepID=A0A1I2J108_9BACT|nr:7TM diverse intracellular signaling domain-containing protein [Thermoflexibacter ruber]SFF47553.1 Serine phosphatase RsbU, regulator of sigma subunit [Thermoflexibacter ruber]